MAGPSGAWANRYREKWTWDKVTFGSHSVDCYPGGCSFRVYTKGDKIVREEQSALWSPTEPGVPDLNPMGCQKGACWSHCHYSPDRVTEPLKRVGERGKGQFEAVSWDEALGDIADAMLDAIEDQGVESIITPLTPEVGAGAARQHTYMLGTPTTDGNAEFQDFSPGWHITWGLYNPTASMDDWFLAELDADLAREPGLHQHPVVPLRGRVPIQRRRGSDDRPGLQPLGDSRGQPPADPDRHRCGAGAGDVQGDHRRRLVQEAFRAGADGSPAAGAQGQRPLPARIRRGGRGARGPVLLVGHADRDADPGAARDAGDHRRGSRAGGELLGTAQGHDDGGGGAGLRAPATSPGGLHPGEGG